MKIFTTAAIVAISVFTLQVKAQEISGSLDPIERDAMMYSSRKQVGTVTPFVSLSSYEFKAGGNNSHVKPTQRFGFGAFTTLYSGKTVLEAGLSYLPLGARYEATDKSGMHVSQMVDLEYLAVPLIAKKFTRADNTGFFFKIGLVPAYLMKARAEVSLEQSGFVGSKVTASGSVEDKFKSTDVQGTLGIGGVFTGQLNSRILLDLSWGRSLVPISKHSTVDVYNEGFLLSAGFTL